jgi:hypothetical protein
MTGYILIPAFTNYRTIFLTSENQIQYPNEKLSVLKIPLNQYLEKPIKSLPEKNRSNPMKYFVKST